MWRMRMAPSCGLVEQPDIGGAVHDVAQEGVEHEKRPQRGAVITPTRLVLIDQFLEVAPIEEPRAREPFAQKRVAQATAERTPEPPRERNREAHFWPVQDLPRQPRFHRLLEQPFAF